MRRLHAFVFRVRGLFGRNSAESDLAAELQLHLDALTERNIAAGMSPEDARFAARREFGGVEQIKEQARDIRAFRWLDELRQDLQFAFRQIRKAPGFAATAILTIAIGLGACTALFSIVNGVLLRPLRFPEPDRIVVPVERSIAPGEYFEWKEGTTVFAQFAVHLESAYSFTADGVMTRLRDEEVTAGFFAALKIQPMLGRDFSPDDDRPGHDRVAILSYRAWQTNFGGRADIIGQRIRLDDLSFAVVGVLPNENIFSSAAVFTPLIFGDAARQDYGSHAFKALGRLKPGVSLAQAEADVNRVNARIVRAHPESATQPTVRLVPLIESLVGNIRWQLFVLLAAVGLLLAIACVNVASLLLARANARRTEIAVRVALGANRGRIVRQFLVESLLLAVLGGALGVLLASASLDALVHFASTYIVRTDDVILDWRVLAGSFGLMLLAGVGFGLVPAVLATRSDRLVLDASRTSSAGRRQSRAQSLLVSLEIALALILLFVTGLLVRTLIALQRENVGLDPDNVVTMPVVLGPRYNTPEKAMALVEQTTARLAALPNVDAAAFSWGLPLVGFDELLITRRGADEPIRTMRDAETYAVTPNYFKTLRIPLVTGRGFTADDRSGSPRVVLINETLARAYFPDVNPIGQRIMILTMANTPDVWREIVGVVGDVRPYGPQSPVIPQVYEPLAQRPTAFLNLIARAKAGSPPLTTELREVLHSIDPSLPLDEDRRYGVLLAQMWSAQRFSLVLFSLFSAIALLLAAIGLYGVMAYSVTQRTTEIGIRLALGATPRQVLGFVFAGASRIIAIGLLMGTVGSLLAGRALTGLLFHTAPWDPATLAGVVLTLAGVALLASWLPARRAAKLDPLVALRCE